MQLFSFFDAVPLAQGYLYGQIAGIAILVLAIGGFYLSKYLSKK
ncbi:hypothetical protein MFFC18_22360 [Mariniblastus fucicola]|uniref:Uncharacterized protein n=1 Tax=Mariniblastus fucicola TaxID=980251 RepID=A0A5B9PCT4_9BACT|nr:hypothetical protein MFFC18_22360 [Mariniblastus fucicola]